MTRFIICDTEPEFLEKLAMALHREFDPCSVEYLYGPAALEVSLREDAGGADVLLTEIELRGENAIEIIGKNLKQSSPLQVIYMTRDYHYCTEVYDTPHCGFILKPVQRDKLIRDVGRAILRLKRKKQEGILLRKNGNLYVLTPASILSIESSARVVRIRTDDEVLDVYDKLDHLAFQLDRRFLQCHKSYLVNMDRVRRFCRDSFLMDNGDLIPISQSRRKDVRETFLQYVDGDSET